MRRIHRLVWAGLLLAVGGCHTVQLESDPPGAAVYVDGEYWGTTPCSHTWVLGEKAAGYNAAMVLPGYSLSDCPQLPRGPGLPYQDSLLTGAPNGAKVFVNGTYVGDAPLFRDVPFPMVIRAEWSAEKLAAATKYQPGQVAGPVAQPAAAPMPPPQPTPQVAAGTVRGRFAVVVGLSQYKFRGKWGLSDLRYAADDARNFAAYLQSPQGGRFDQVVLLTDEQATTQNLKIAIREKLRGVQKDDMVVVFWSGHGGADPGDPSSLFLLTYDTDPEHMPATGYAMEEFKNDIARLEARRVLILADTCHSAGISDPSVEHKGPPQANRIVEGVKGVYVADSPAEQTGPMRMIFTSCESGETSIESSQLGGGHGAFTWFLMEGLRGQADQVKNGGDGDGVVNLGELIGVHPRPGQALYSEPAASRHGWTI